MPNTFTLGGKWRAMAWAGVLSTSVALYALLSPRWLSHDDSAIGLRQRHFANVAIGAQTWGAYCSGLKDSTGDDAKLQARIALECNQIELCFYLLAVGVCLGGIGTCINVSNNFLPMSMAPRKRDRLLWTAAGYLFIVQALLVGATVTIFTNLIWDEKSGFQDAILRDEWAAGAGFFGAMAAFVLAFAAAVAAFARRDNLLDFEEEAAVKARQRRRRASMKQKKRHADALANARRAAATYGALLASSTTKPKLLGGGGGGGDVESGRVGYRGRRHEEEQQLFLGPP